MTTTSNFTQKSNATQIRKPHKGKITKMFHIIAGRDLRSDFSQNPESVKFKVRTANIEISTGLWTAAKNFRR